MCFSKTPKQIETPPPLPATSTPQFGNEDLKKSKKSKKYIGIKQLQIPLGGSSSIGTRSGMGVPKV
jgi:hypothetical protein